MSWQKGQAGLAGDERDYLWSGHGPSGQDPKDEGKGRKVKGAHRVFLDWEKVVREGVNKDTVQIGHHGGESVA